MEELIDQLEAIASGINTMEQLVHQKTRDVEESTAVANERLEKTNSRVS